MSNDWKKELIVVRVTPIPEYHLKDPIVDKFVISEFIGIIDGFLMFVTEDSVTHGLNTEYIVEYRCINLGV